VVSFTRGASDVIAVYDLAATAVPDLDAGFELDVVPLFETRADLAAAGETMDELMAVPVFADRVAARQGRIEVMLGYSDSAKEIGVLAANLAIYRAQVDMATWARAHKLRLTIFHGRGGALGRGGGPASRAILGQAPGSLDGGFKTTEQGEVAFARYGNLRIARRHLEQMTSAVMVASTPAHAGRLEACWDRFRAAAMRMADASEAAYRALIGRPGFVDLFMRATPMEEIEALAIGSRPARRPAGPGAGDLTELRAIPWVFAWGQSRINLPGWYGLGAGLAAVAGERGGLAQLRAMAAEWPFFTSFLENAELSLAKADAPIAELYLALGNDAAIAAAIVEEHARTTDLVLSITGHDAPLAGRPLLRTAVDLRNPYVDALSFLQLRFLRAAREDPADAESRRLVQITINGVAAGLQNTG
jgi:phosphoenolpyruvate carboxylase